LSGHTRQGGQDLTEQRKGMSHFKDFYSACLASGYYRYIDQYYDINISTNKPRIVNIQLRYWVEAVEKFYRLDKNQYNENTIEEGVFIINLLANSLSVLGGMNVKSEKSRTPPLLDLYSGDAWDLRSERPDLYKALEDLNSDYNKLSKHMNKSRVELLKDISYEKLQRFMDSTREIWKWVLSKEGMSGDVESLFDEPSELLGKDSL